MTRRYWPLILTLAAVWGASYLFIKVGVDGGFSPGALMAARALLAGVVLLGYLFATIGASDSGLRLRAAWRQSLVLGLLNAALPFWLVAWGETHIDSGLAAIAQATVPIFSLLIGLRFLPHERIGRARILGVGIGLVGVAFVAGVAPAGNRVGCRRNARRRPRLRLLRLGRDLRPAPPARNDLGARARDRFDARGRPHPAAARDRPAADLDAHRRVRSGRCCCCRSSARRSPS